MMSFGVKMMSFGVKMMSFGVKMIGCFTQKETHGTDIQLRLLRQHYCTIISTCIEK